MDNLDPLRVYPNPRDPAETLDRRDFLGLLGASAAAAGVGGCSPQPAPHGELIPYVRPPEQSIPGRPLHYASAMTLGESGLGILATSREGRPTKIEGNPDHPGSLGASDVFSQGSLLGLYDPDRSKQPSHRHTPATWDEAIAALRTSLQTHRATDGTGVRILTGASVSPTFISLMHELLAPLKRARWVRYEPFGRASAREGAQRAFGSPYQAVYDFTKADVVVSLASDFLSCSPGTVRYQWDFANRRRVRHRDSGGVAPAKMSRLYAVECSLSNTGMSADHRLALKPSAAESFARALAAELKIPGVPSAGPLPEIAHAWLAPLSRELGAHKGRSLILTGDCLPPSAHALGHALNYSLGNAGETVRLIEAPAAGPTPGDDSLEQLVRDMDEGRVDLLLILGPNPAFTAAADLRFGDALKKVAVTAHLGSHADETAELCQWHLPEAHYLESWGDARGFDGAAAIQQPLIEPLYGGRSALEFVAALIGGERRGRELVMEHWRRTKGNGSTDFWQKALQKGVIPDTASAVKEVKLAGDWARQSEPITYDSSLEIEFQPDPTLYDGRFANNGWLQELPKPVTKLTWGNAALMSPATAASLGISQRADRRGGEHGSLDTDVVELHCRGRSVRAPALIVTGQADNTITVYLGHGRTRAGQVGNGVGFDAYPLRGSDASWFDRGLKVVKTGDRATLACTQSHHQMDGKDFPLRHTTAAAFAADPRVVTPSFDKQTELAAATELSAVEPPPADERDGRIIPLTLYPGWPYNGHKWAMGIDLSVCTGCSACVVACQAENNSPVVGREQVIRAREMHWIRVDRYVESGEQFFQPVPCMQCENAPCEYVCPVGATVHSSDGLNDMIYNRCVGTRYCSNNCPYKIRRFNFLLFSDWVTETLKLGRNPEVTVRSRGVMEKCSYCVQRIRGAEIESSRSGEPIVDGRLQTACQQACPSQAIRFGNLNDPGAEVRRWKEQPHNYALLEELNTRPRTTYLAAVRNPNPDMPKGA